MQKTNPQKQQFHLTEEKKGMNANATVLRIRGKVTYSNLQRRFGGNGGNVSQLQSAKVLYLNSAQQGQCPFVHHANNEPHNVIARYKVSNMSNTTTFLTLSLLVNK